jgi:hypothetical protein
VLWGANNPVTFSQAPGTWLTYNDLPEAAYFATLGELDQDRALQQAAVSYLRGLDFQTLAASLTFKGLSFFGIYDSLDRVLNLIVAGGILLLLLFRLFRQRRIRPLFWQMWRQRTVQFLGLLILAAVINAIVFFGDYRFRLPLEPAIAILTSVAFTILIQPSSSLKR